MKRLFVAVAAFALAAGIASAQDFNAAVETFNNGAQTLESNKADALTQFKSALAQFEACTEDEAADMVAQCKKIIPQTILSIAKEQINEANYDEALETLKEAAAVAEGYGIEEIAADAKDLVPTAYTRKGAALLKAKDFAGAAAAFKAAVSLNPEDGQNQLLYGQALMQAGDNAGAIAALEAAAANGKAEQAGKLLANAFLKEGMALVKAGKSAEAIEALEKSNSYVESANAFKLIASANTKLGKSKAAIEAYKKYLEVDPAAKDAADVMFTIAATAQKAGDKATATEYYKKLSGTKYAEQAKAQLAALAK
ncbi:MAG: tetratricopeptide repeat protein [Bacteroidales bacterium]|nr:tetratricopeptide repeat protein [Bacteroidales bacterium]MBR3096940.1 tetratricopeptide repeat protein [Bacteroidales bacterium]MBR4687248.1 tetratricopeptide repeat protein [Bacteroidales bacterium]